MQRGACRLPTRVDHRQRAPAGRCGQNRLGRGQPHGEGAAVHQQAEFLLQVARDKRQFAGRAPEGKDFPADASGAGFQLASHDLDIRGAGNLLGDEQSGHIKEVGYELYQQMLEDAVTALKAGIDEPVEEAWSPTIALGAPVTIPEDYVEDLTVRLGLYRRLSTLENDAEMESFGAELIDRFGPLPPEVEQLLKIVTIKILCRDTNVEKVEAGDVLASRVFAKGAVEAGEGR